MATVVVVFHSGYGHTLRMAQAVATGADAELLAIDAEGWKNEFALIEEHYARFGAKLPKELRTELKALEGRLND